MAARRSEPGLHGLFNRVKATLRDITADPRHADVRLLLLALTVLAGAVDAVSILSLGHVFVSNMTGNTVFTSLKLAGAPGPALASSFSAVGGFVFGVLVSRIPAGRERMPVALVRNSVFWQALLLTAAAVLSAVAGPHPSDAPLRVLLAVAATAMGMQNSLADRVGVAGMTTTVMTRAIVGLVNAIGTTWSVTLTFQALSICALVAGVMLGAQLVDHVSPEAALGCIAAAAWTVALLAHVRLNGSRKRDRPRTSDR
ncbi:YoaK family protein [Streptomyces sp. 150FB]|uniref:YoaK family protein n=1 Tax=Streptomyces sp. 150FB TaxID=1576605 RepID=UPI0006963E4E|nr:YoaK family protein [Streptomyces sp. 150FB]